MRLPHVLLRGGAIIVLVSLTIACNTILGVDDVSPRNCHAKSDYGQIVANSSTTWQSDQINNLTYSALFVNLDVSTVLNIQLYSNQPLDASIIEANANEPYLLTIDDTKSETCKLCISVNTFFDTESGQVSQTFQPLAYGTLTLTNSTSTRVTGSVQGLVFRHVNILDGVTSDVHDGCSVKIGTVDFDLTRTVTPVAR